MAIFKQKWPKFPICFYIDPIWLSHISIQLIVISLLFKIKNLYYIMTLKMAIFQPKNCQKWPWMAKTSFFISILHYPALRISTEHGCTISFKVRKYEIIYCQKHQKWPFFIKEWPKNWLDWLKFPTFFHWSNMIMPYEYPVNWDALILLYQGTTSQFIDKNS